MKKYLFGALALPLLFACSADDLTEQAVVSNDQFAGIDKVDAVFSMADEGPATRMATQWALEEGDVYGLAWLQDGLSTHQVSINGFAFQNHPLTQTDGIFQPTTSIYTGKYYLYRPYDETTVEPQAINFNSLTTQPLAEGMASSGDAWKGLAKSAIIIADKWTDVTKAGTDLDGDGVLWNKAGTSPKFKIYASFFSNQTGLDLTYVKNNVTFGAATTISGATDIEYSYAAGDEVGSADIYDGTVQLGGAANSFTYAPTAETMEPVEADGITGSDHSGAFWADKSNIATTYGFTFPTTASPITLEAEDEDGVSTGADGSTGWFWFNSLPVTDATGATTTNVVTVLNSSYGAVTVNSTVGDCAYAFEKLNTTDANPQWIKLASADDATASPAKWDVSAASHNTFINQYGNHKGKYALTVDFSKGVMNGMHVKNDRHLQKLLKYYIASGKTNETSVVLNLDEASSTDNTFEISKISIALLQTINAGGTNTVKVQACNIHGTPKIIVTQDGQSDLGLADAKEVPALNGVFAAATDVYLASDCEWTWGGNYGINDDGTDPLPVDANVSSLTNEGALTVNATNVELSTNVLIYNAADATMNITQVTTVKNTLHNYGTLNVGSASNTTAELRAYNARVYNNATALDAYGVINNYGVVGSTSGTTGAVNNWGGTIYMMNDGAMTLLKSNEKGTNPFANPFDATNFKMGTVVLPENNPTAIVSVNNAAENGFIKYNWTGATYATPAGNVKYNTIVVSSNIEFTADEDEIQYIEFNGTRTLVVNPAASNHLTKLKGIIVNANKSIIIEKTNIISCSVGAYLGSGATVYKGGTFTYPTGATTNYFGTWSTDQVVVWGD